MSRRAAQVTQADVARAIRAAEQARPGGWRVRVVGPEIVIEPAETPAPVEGGPEPERTLDPAPEWRL